MVCTYRLSRGISIIFSPRPWVGQWVFRWSRLKGCSDPRGMAAEFLLPLWVRQLSEAFRTFEVPLFVRKYRGTFIDVVRREGPMMWSRPWLWQFMRRAYTVVNLEIGLTHLQEIWCWRINATVDRRFWFLELVFTLTYLSAILYPIIVISLETCARR